jgi:hypothetical protein
MPSSSINGAISFTNRALIDDSHYLQQITDYWLGDTDALWAQYQLQELASRFLSLIVTVAPIWNPRDHALSDLCLISISINCPQYCLRSFFRKHWTLACNCSCDDLFDRIQLVEALLKLHKVC